MNNIVDIVFAILISLAMGIMIDRYYVLKDEIEIVRCENEQMMEDLRDMNVQIREFEEQMEELALAVNKLIQDYEDEEDC